MILYDVFKVLSDNVSVLVRNQENIGIFSGSLNSIPSMYFMWSVTEIKPLSKSVLMIYIIEK